MNNEKTTNRYFRSELYSSVNVFIAICDIQEVIFFAVVLQNKTKKKGSDEWKAFKYWPWKHLHCIMIPLWHWLEEWHCWRKRTGRLLDVSERVFWWGSRTGQLSGRRVPDTFSCRAHQYAISGPSQQSPVKKKKKLKRNTTTTKTTTAAAE